MSRIDLPWEVIPRYRISGPVVDRYDVARGQGAMVSAIGVWDEITVLSADGSSIVLTDPTIQIEGTSIAVTSSEGQLMLASPQGTRRVGDDLAVSGFVFAQIVRPDRPWRTVCDVVLDGEIVLRPPVTMTGWHHGLLPNNDQADTHRPIWRDHAEPESEPVARQPPSLWAALTAPEALRTLARRPPAWVAGLLGLAGVALAATGIVTGPTDSSGWSETRILVGVGLLIAGLVTRRRQLRVIERRFSALGWIGVGHLVLGLSRSSAVEVIVPRDWPAADIGRAMASIERTLATTGARHRLARRIGVRSIWCRTGHAVLPSLSSRVVLRRVSRLARAGVRYAVVPDSHVGRAHVLSVRPHVLRSVADG